MSNFSFFRSVFKRLVQPTRKNQGLFGIGLPFPKQALVFKCVRNKSFENTEGKGEIAHNEQFLHFPQCFLPLLEKFLPFSSNLKLSSANSFSLEESKICLLQLFTERQHFRLAQIKSILKMTGKILVDWPKLTLSQMINFRLFQTERVCRQQF